MTESPKVSVIIPCFNLGQYLDEAVESVLAQTFQDFEILILDDGSTDVETRQILRDYARPNTTVFRTPNRGLAAARNYLIGRARGEYLCALDADDRLHANYLEKTVGTLEKDRSLTFVSTLLQMFEEEERIWPSERECDLGTLLCDDTVITPALVRRAAVLSVGGYDEKMPHPGDEDWDLWLTLVEAGYQGTIVPEVLFFYRRRANSMCVQCTRGQTHLDLIEYIVGKHRKSYRDHLWRVLIWKDGHVDDLRRANAALETHLTTYLAPTVARRRAELQQLRTKLSEARAREEGRNACDRLLSVEGQLELQSKALRALEEDHRRVLDELCALRDSASWKVTAPLRAVYERLRRLPGGRTA